MTTTLLSPCVAAICWLIVTRSSAVVMGRSGWRMQLPKPLLLPVAWL